MPNQDYDALAREVAPIVEQIKPALTGRDDALVGAALADLLAMWIAGHRVLAEGDVTPERAARETGRLQNGLLNFHMKQVRHLIPVNRKIVDATPGLPVGRP
jgi:hypothetical protein